MTLTVRKDIMRKYNLYLKGMVDNWREIAKQKGLTTSHLTDEQLFAIIDANATAGTYEEQFEWTLEDIAETCLT